MSVKITYYQNFKTKLLKNGVLIIGFDYRDRPVNVLDSEVMEELDRIIRKEIQNKFVAGIVIVSLKNGSFIAGADVNKIYSITEKNLDQAKNLIAKAHNLFSTMEKSEKPFIAAIDGACLGGGMELALACHMRVATDHPKTVLGLPEVKLGIIPGFGGTQRLPKLVGLPIALSIILKGNSIYPYKALKMGLIDDLVPHIPVENRSIENIEKESFVSVAIKRALEPMSQKKKLPLRQRFWSMPVARKVILSKAKYDTKKAVRNYYPAPYKAIEAIQRGIGRSTINGCFDVEMPIVLELITSPLSKQLLDIYFWSETAKKTNHSVFQKNTKVGVIGSGFMGSQIAANMSESGIETVLKDIDPKFVSAGLDRIAQVWRKDLDKKAIKPVEFNKRSLRIYPTTNWEQLKKSEFVIEAIKEILPLKQKLVEEFETATSSETVFATNTSSFTVVEIAQKAKYKERFVAMHFFNPLRAMKLVEIGVADFTSNETKGKAIGLSLALGKIPIVIKDSPGFLVNRIISRYMIEAVMLITEGVPIESIDKAAEDFGMAIDSGRAMGPLKLIDYVGTETAVHVVHSLAKLGPRIAIPILFQIADFKQSFWKNGKLNPELREAIKTLSMPKKRPDQLEIQDRLILPMIDESYRCLEDKVIDDPKFIDLAMILGVGFPAFRGGPITWAREVGAAKITERLESFKDKHGPRFEPCELLLENIKI